MPNLEQLIEKLNNNALQEFNLGDYLSDLLKYQKFPLPKTPIEKKEYKENLDLLENTLHKITSAVCSNRSLRTIVISKTPSKYINAFLTGIGQNTRISSLCFKNNPRIGGAIGSILRAYLKSHPRLINLEFTENQLCSKAGFKQICKGIKEQGALTHFLWTNNLVDCRCPEAPKKIPSYYLKQVLKETKIQTLHLSGQSFFEERDILEIILALQHNQSIQHLVLDDLPYVSKSLLDGTLTTLLSTNQSLITLSLNQSGLHSTQKEAIFAALKHHPTITSLSLNGIFYKFQRPLTPIPEERSLSKEDEDLEEIPLLASPVKPAPVGFPPNQALITKTPVIFSQNISPTLPNNRAPSLHRRYHTANAQTLRASVRDQAQTTTPTPQAHASESDADEACGTCLIL